MRQAREQDVERDLVRASSGATAPSTSAIIRSRNVSPGFDVMRTMIWSESTRVPPVTAERSPPDSRMTGADSPVIADSSTEAMPSMISPSPGISSPAVTTHSSPTRRSFDDFSTIGAVGLPDARHRLGAGLAQRVGLRLAAALGDRLGEVREQHGEPQPRGDEAGEHAVGRGRRRQLLEEQDRREDAADLDDEHHRVARHLARVELHERVDDRPLHDRGIEQRLRARRAGPDLRRPDLGRLGSCGGCRESCVRS